MTRRHGPPPPADRQLNSDAATAYLRRRAGANETGCPGLAGVDLLAEAGLIRESGRDVVHGAERRGLPRGFTIAYYRRGDLDALLARFGAVVGGAR